MPDGDWGETLMAMGVALACIFIGIAIMVFVLFAMVFE